MNKLFEKLKKELEDNPSLRTNKNHAAKIRDAILEDVRLMATKAMMTDYAIAKVFDLSGSTVKRVRDENNIPNGGDLRSALEQKQMIEAWEKYKDPNKVAEVVGIHPDTSRERLKKLHKAGKVVIPVKRHTSSPLNVTGVVKHYFQLPVSTAAAIERGNAKTRKTMQQKASDTAAAGYFENYWNKKFSKYHPETQADIRKVKDARV